jgi:hypothetical protein
MVVFTSDDLPLCKLPTPMSALSSTWPEWLAVVLTHWRPGRYWVDRDSSELI